MSGEIVDGDIIVAKYATMQCDSAMSGNAGMLFDPHVRKFLEDEEYRNEVIKLSYYTKDFILNRLKQIGALTQDGKFNIHYYTSKQLSLPIVNQVHGKLN